MDLFMTNGVMADDSCLKTRRVGERRPRMVVGASSHYSGARSSLIYSGTHDTGTLTSQSRGL